SGGSVCNPSINRHRTGPPPATASTQLEYVSCRATKLEALSTAFSAKEEQLAGPGFLGQRRHGPDADDTD
ncbi:MAG TPA: hypothetical protein VKP30_18080, partial [Polyangiaceae bacterium]|nr:hypothetical protein [Polyangiaceae bacterium]